MQQESQLLLPSYTVAFSTELACVLGSDRRAQILQQVSYWLDLASGREGAIGKFEDGRWWVYQEMHIWLKRFAYMSENTIKAHRKTLENKGVLLRKDEVDPKAPGGVRIWYSIDYDRLEELRQAYVAPPDEDDEGDEDDENHEDEGGAGGGPEIGPVPQGGGPEIGPVWTRNWSTFTIRNNKTSSMIHNGSAAPPAGADGGGSPHDAALPLEQKQTPKGQQSYIQSVKGKGPRDRTKEKPARTDTDEGSKRRVNPADLTELGKLIVHLSGKGSHNKVPTTSLTEKQAQRLDVDVEFFYGNEKIVVTPNELYGREPKLVREWLEKVVHPKLYARYAKKRGYVLSRDKLINVLTLEGSDGFDIRSYYEWRESRKHLERLDADSHAVAVDEDVAFVNNSLPPVFEPIPFEYVPIADEAERSANDDEQE